MKVKPIQKSRRMEMLSKSCVAFSCLICAVAYGESVGGRSENDRTSPPAIEEAEKCTEAIVELAMPVWPMSALRAGSTGWTLIRYDLDGSGRATNATVHSAAPEQVFDKSSLLSIKRSKFKAGISRTGCKALIVYSNVPT